MTDQMHIDESSVVALEFESGERWWGGTVKDGIRMPFDGTSYHRDLGVPEVDPNWPEQAEDSNQAAPILVSTHGRVVASKRPFAISIRENVLVVEGSDIETYQAGTCLRDAYLAASQRYFPPVATTPARVLFAGVQYNTWIETPLTPTQESVLKYAESIVEAGLPPGVLIIDDNWATDHGTLRFDTGRFPDAKGMLAHLRTLGFATMLWLVPFVSPDSVAFRECEAAGLLVRDANGRTAIRRWWNGYSALLDVSSPRAVAWLTDQLDALRELGVGGFKFDAGDVRDYRADDQIENPCDPVDMCENWARIGVRYPLNEYRACWRMGGQPLGQRLRDKPPTWDSRGIGSLIPEMLAQGMIGHPWVCPDMVGGGEVGAMSEQLSTDQEFFVRYAQIAALSPMIQFSVNPARVLNRESLDAVKEALSIRAANLPRILDLVEQAAVTGEPVIRPMAYHEDGYADVNDHFFVGRDLLVAPVLEPGATIRRMHVPPGVWETPNKNMVQGPSELDLPVALSTIPRLLRRG